jgi:hypothetical protein
MHGELCEALLEGLERLGWPEAVREKYLSLTISHFRHPEICPMPLKATKHV